MAEIEQALEREDRERLTELVQLVLGKAAAAGLKELAAQAARLMQSAEGEQSWTVLRHTVADFAREAQSNTPAHEG
jgi:HPt (histidine-containing phosphotransfer) domain-containing protein